MSIRKKDQLITDQKIKIDNVFEKDWVKENLKKVEKLHSMLGNTELYPLVKSVLNDFFSNGRTVVIMTPFIDEDKLYDIFALFINNEGKGKCLWVLTRSKLEVYDHLSKKKQNISVLKLKENAIMRIPAKFKNLLNLVKIPIMSGIFHMKLIAGICSNSVSVLSTSANMTGHHFDLFDYGRENIDSVQFSTMQVHEFENNIMKNIWPLLEPSDKAEMCQSFQNQI